jgi:hypothetical protein
MLSEETQAQILVKEAITSFLGQQMFGMVQPGRALTVQKPS